jgi:hypothetical protein
MNRETDLLLQSGIAAVRSGDKREGARLLAQVVRKEPQSEDAWFWLAAATDQPAEAAACLRRVLAINPNNARARQALNMLDTGQGQAAFNTGPLENEANGDSTIRPLSTGDLSSPYTTPPPVVPPVQQTPPPPFANNPYGGEPTVQVNTPPPFTNNPYGGEPTVPATPPPFANNPYGGGPTVPATPPPFAWTPQSNGEMPPDPYSVNTMPSPPPPQSNMPPPPPFTGGSGVRLGQLDPNAAMSPNIPPAQGPVPFDPGAELRASLLPPTPVNAVPPPGQPVVVKKKRRRFSPLLLVLLAIVVLLLAALIAYLLLNNNSTNQVASVSSAGQTATAGSNLTATATAQGTPGAANGTPGVNGTFGAGTAGAGTPGSAANGTPGVGANGTPGTGPNGSGTLPAGTVQPGQGTVQGGGQPGNPTVTVASGVPGPTATPVGGPAGSGTGGEPGSNATPTIVPGLGTEVPPPTVRDNRPPPEVVNYVNDTATYFNTAQFYETAIFEGIVKPYKAGRIKPGVTRINIPAFSVPNSQLAQPISTSLTVAGTPGATAGAGTPAATRTPNATQTPVGTPGLIGNGTPGVTGSATTGTTPQVTSGTGTATSPVAAGVPEGARKVIIDGPKGPEIWYLLDAGQIDMSVMTLSLGKVARVVKDQPVPAGGYELSLVAVEYANDLSNMANAMDMFFQSGQVSYLNDLSNYYDKAVKDRDRWAQMVANGYPFRLIL